MKKLKNSLDYTLVLKYLIITFAFILFNNIEREALPYSLSLYTAIIIKKNKVIAPTILLLLSFIFFLDFGFLLCVSISAIIMNFIKLLYKKLNYKNDLLIIGFTIFSLCGFLAFGNTSYFIIIEKRVISSILICILAFLCYGALTFLEKGFKFKPSNDEILSLSCFIICIGLGICNLFSILIWKGISVFMILICCYLLRFGLTTVISAVLGISVAIYLRNASIISCFLLLGLSAECCKNYSRYLSAFAIVGADYIFYNLFGFYSVYDINQLISVLCGSVAFCIIPTAILKNLKEKLYAFREKQLVRKSINTNRLLLSNRLFELSGIFSEMSNAFTSFSKKSLNENTAKQLIYKKLTENICKSCVNYSKCLSIQNLNANAFFKLIDIGFAKGKLSLIDIPKEVIDNCTHASEILYGFNKMLADYRLDSIENQNIQNGRQIIADETDGVAEILRGLALESGTLLKYQSRLERQLNSVLLKNGFLISEILIYGEEDRLSISMIITMQEFSIKELQDLISKTINKDMILADKSMVTQDKTYLLFRKSAPFDAVFGVTKKIKDCSSISGDTYSATRINRDKFLVALSDGMGSGNKAESISSTSLSLIEGFYKAGMKSEIILGTVNKLLAINSEDTFTALDVAVIDLNLCSVDFIKYGSPYGFIINEGGVRIVEGNSLPLGILSELKPSVCTFPISNNDMILLISDGISEAFGSSGEIIDYIRKVPALNPQSLTDGIMQQALNLSQGKSNDDMTAVAVRIFKKQTVV